MSDPARAAAALVAAALVLVLLGRWSGLRDRRPPEEQARKPRLTPVALSGGPALLVSLAVWLALDGSGLRTIQALGPFARGGLAPLGQGEDLPLAALGLAFLVGLVDDLRGLGVLPKLAGQTLVGLALVVEWAVPPPLAPLLVVVTVAALNVWNVMDHADGMASLPALPFLWPVPGVLPGLLAFLPANLLLRRGPERAPLAYLGDSGSHLLGLLVLLSPLGPWALVVPTADLLRVLLLRRRQGRRAWEGDRSHLGHRLEGAGLGPLGSALVAAGLSLPGLLALGGPSLATLLLAGLLPLVGLLAVLRRAGPGT